MTQIMEKPYADTPSPGSAFEIAPGFFWVAMPIPYPPGYVNIWLMDEGDGWTIVDTGMNTSKVRETWELLIDSVLKDKPVKRLICTHCHEDHMGLAGWLEEKFGTVLWTTRMEWLTGRLYNAIEKNGWEMDVTSFYLGAGTGYRVAKMLAGANHPYATKLGRVPANHRRIRNNEEIQIGGHSWRVMTGHGHSPEHACLFCQELNLLISGDIILPEICPVLCVFPNEPDEDTVQDYLDSLKKFEALPDDVLVLPAHGLPFRGLMSRLAAIPAYYGKQQSKILAACGKPMSAGQLVMSLFPGRTSPGPQFIALTEILGQLNHLLKVGKLTRQKQEQIWLHQRTHKDTAP